MNTNESKGSHQPADDDDDKPRWGTKEDVRSAKKKEQDSQVEAEDKLRYGVKEDVRGKSSSDASKKPIQDNLRDGKKTTG
jgi:hypothetical protein